MLNVDIKKEIGEESDIVEEITLGEALWEGFPSLFSSELNEETSDVEI